MATASASILAVLNKLHGKTPESAELADIVAALKATSPHDVARSDPQTALFAASVAKGAAVKARLALQDEEASELIHLAARWFAAALSNPSSHGTEAFMQLEEDSVAFDPEQPLSKVVTTNASKAIRVIQNVLLVEIAQKVGYLRGSRAKGRTIGADKALAPVEKALSEEFAPSSGTSSQEVHGVVSWLAAAARQVLPTGGTEESTVQAVNACVFYTFAGCANVYNELPITPPKCVVNAGRPEYVIPVLTRGPEPITTPAATHVVAVLVDVPTTSTALGTAAPRLPEFGCEDYDEAVYKFLGIAVRVLKYISNRHEIKSRIETLVQREIPVMTTRKGELLPPKSLLTTYQGRKDPSKTLELMNLLVPAIIRGFMSHVSTIPLSSEACITVAGPASCVKRFVSMALGGATVEGKFTDMGSSAFAELKAVPRVKPLDDGWKATWCKSLPLCGSPSLCVVECVREAERIGDEMSARTPPCPVWIVCMRDAPDISAWWSSYQFTPHGSTCQLLCVEGGSLPSDSDIKEQLRFVRLLHCAIKA